MFRYIAPAGTDITIIELLKFIIGAVSGSDKRDQLRELIKNKYNVKYCYLMSSARAAMAMLLKMLKKHNTDTKRTEVIIPSYTCYSVAAAVEIAGLTIRICDIDPDTLSYEKDQFDSIDFSKVLCIITANLYGYPDDLSYIESIAKKNGCYLIDDSAQSMNAKQDNRYSGSFGDIGLYSLDKGKNITSLQGGIIVTNNDKLNGLISKNIAKLPLPGTTQIFFEIIKLIVYSILIRPIFYWIPAKLPFLGLGKTIYTTDYLFTQYSKQLSNISYMLFMRIDSITEKRKIIHNKISNILKENKSIRILKSINHSTEPAYLRTAFFIKDTHIRDTIVAKLNTLGIGATTSYPESIAELNEIKHFSLAHNNKASNGIFVAKHIMTLPNISYLSDMDIKKIKNVIDTYVTYAN